MTVKQKTRVPYDFGKLALEEQIKISKDHMGPEEPNMNEGIAQTTKRKLDEFRALNIR